jgi:hypothetical protein
MALGDVALGAAAADAAVRPLLTAASSGVGAAGRRVAVDPVALLQAFADRSAASAPAIVARPAQAAAPQGVLALSAGEPGTGDGASQALRARAAYSNAAANAASTAGASEATSVEAGAAGAGLQSGAPQGALRLSLAA